jgi:Flp pilus assembly protein TadG
MMATRASRRPLGRRGREGQALVEFALVLPLLLIMLMGLIDVGRIIFTYIALEDAAQEGTIYMAHEPSPAAVVIARVKSSSNHPEVMNATVPTPVCTIAPAPGIVSVTASYELPLLTPFGRELFGGSFSMSATFVGTNFKGTC